MGKAEWGAACCRSDLDISGGAVAPVPEADGAASRRDGCEDLGLLAPTGGELLLALGDQLVDELLRGDPAVGDVPGGAGEVGHPDVQVGSAQPVHGDARPQV